MRVVLGGIFADLGVSSGTRVDRHDDKTIKLAAGI